MAHLSRKRSREAGSAMLEFCLCIVILMPLLLGLCGGGIALVRQIELTQTSRDAGHLYSKGIDFSQAANQALIVKIADSLNFGGMSPSGGIYLSTVTYITSADCVAGGFPNGCANQKHYVITHQIKIGNPAPSSIGLAVNPDSGGNVSEATYLNNSKDQVLSFSSDIGNLWTNLNEDGQLAYVSEASVQSSDLAWTGYFNNWLTAISYF
ncbi:MAG TPA: TadE/TadG family type IV pilus assembly protein [Bryobacteraceae bacterium]|jgi:Flp pilus assembly protein TadG|nr:TadE/TadG family type IV pilus assembly protein [Bryobacteraceae bacterium]